MTILSLSFEEEHLYTKGCAGISLGHFVVRHGGSNLEFFIFPNIPPNASDGIPKNIQKRRMTKIVPKGSAAVVP